MNPLKLLSGLAGGHVEDLIKDIVTDVTADQLEAPIEEFLTHRLSDHGRELLAQRLEACAAAVRAKDFKAAAKAIHDEIADIKL